MQKYTHQRKYVHYKWQRKGFIEFAQKQVIDEGRGQKLVEDIDHQSKVFEHVF